MSVEEKTTTKLPLEARKEATDEFILLSILVYAKKHGYKLQRMQLMKILQRVKERSQNDLDMEIYHKEFVKNTYGDFCRPVYNQLTNLKQADFITSIGQEPEEKFYSTGIGEKAFEDIRMRTGEENERLDLIKTLIERTVEKEGRKSSQKLRDENHKRSIVYEGKKTTVEECPIGAITTPNLEEAHPFVFNTGQAVDWALFRKIAIRKRTTVTPEDEMPTSQEEVHKLLGLA